jgi:hypothetical protein
MIRTPCSIIWHVNECSHPDTKSFVMDINTKCRSKVPNTYFNRERFLEWSYLFWLFWIGG